MITLDDVYPWLNRYDLSHISLSSERLINLVCSALSAGKKDEVNGLLQQLSDLAGKLRDETEVTEILVECAHCYYLLNNLSHADAILMDAVSRAWSDLHRRAVIQWMAGWVKWQTLSGRSQAVIYWRNSLSDFDRLAKQPGLSLDQHAWYHGIAGQLEQSLIEALDQVGSYVDINDAQPVAEAGAASQAPTGLQTPAPAPSPASVTHSKAAPVPDQATTTHSLPVEATDEPTVTHMSDILQLFTISDEIPAGDFGPSGIDPFPIGTVEIDRLAINGHPYRIYSTRGRKIINMPFDQKFIVVKVKGDSMNLENITEQDYVLLRRVDSPSNGDIVLAEVVGTDSHATLKKYTRLKDTITLSPHSTNPAHTPFVFTKVNEGFHIRGVVVAVLKPD
jgi:phage repressor protein C with HTH and peptisase S24 domain